MEMDKEQQIENKESSPQLQKTLNNATINSTATTHISNVIPLPKKNMFPSFSPEFPYQHTPPRPRKEINKKSKPRKKSNKKSPIRQTKLHPFHIVSPASSQLPVLLPCKSLVEQGQDFWHIELNVFKIQFIMVVLLHFQEIVQLEIKLQESSVPAWKCDYCELMYLYSETTRGYIRARVLGV